jgi:hypothetical protein
VFFSISTTPDDYGNIMMGEPLHLTVENHEWWRKKFEAMHCKVIWDKEDVAGKLSQWYVTAYVRGSDLGEFSSHNTTADIVKANVKANMALGLPEVQPYQEQDTHVVLLAGGPSLTDGEDEIKELARAGAQVVTVNGTYTWAMERGITPGAQIIVDAREFNARFCAPMNDRTRFLICSQCDPAFVASLPFGQTVLWHVGGSDLFDAALKEYAEETGNGRDHWPVPGGTTVMNRALPLLLMLGFRKISVFGWDSCIMDGKHHAYAQPENDGDSVRTIEVGIGGRKWNCAGWQAIQAHEFIQLIKLMPDDLQLEVKGDGLLAGILKYSAEQATKGH